MTANTKRIEAPAPAERRPSRGIPAGALSLEDTLRMSQRGRWARRLLWLALAAGLIVAGTVLYQRANAPAPPPGYKTATVVRQDVVSTVSATGSLEPRRTVSIGAEISGRLVAVEVEENDVVTQGQVLARIDTEQLEARLEQAAAQLQAATAGVRQARATLAEARAAKARAEVLGGRGVVSQEAVDTATAAAARAAASVQSALAQERLARAQVDSVKTDLAKAVITSPIDGVVLKRLVEPGTTVVASMQAPELFVIAEDLTQMELHLSVDEADVGVVEEGQRATFTVDAYPERQFEGVVTKVLLASATVGNVVTYETVLSVDNGERLLRPGMTSTASVITGVAEGALVVPNAALRFSPRRDDRGGPPGFGPMGGRPSAEQRARMRELQELMKGSKVFVLRDGRPRPVPVEVGATDGRVTEVRPRLERFPLAEGDAVVIGLEAASAEAAR